MIDFCDIYLICVLYNPSDKCINKWKRFAEEFKNCIFVDNSNFDSNAKDLPNYMPLGENRGIAHAQNLGIKKVKALGGKYLIFFDQDSEVSTGLILSLLNEYKHLEAEGNKIAAIGPALIEINSGKLYKGCTPACNHPQEADSLISSGTLTTISVIDDVGLFNDKLFIDLVDHEWCWRAKSKGYHLFMSGNSLLPHQVGKQTINFLGFPIIISSPFRYYFQFRNTIWLMKCNYAPKEWKRKIIVRKLIEMLVVPFRTGDFTLSIKHISKGIKDGLFEHL